MKNIKIYSILERYYTCCVVQFDLTLVKHKIWLQSSYTWCQSNYAASQRSLTYEVMSVWRFLYKTKMSVFITKTCNSWNPQWLIKLRKLVLATTWGFVSNVQNNIDPLKRLDRCFGFIPFWHYLASVYSK